MVADWGLASLLPFGLMWDMCLKLEFPPPPTLLQTERNAPSRCISDDPWWEVWVDLKQKPMFDQWESVLFNVRPGETFLSNEEV